MGCESGRIDGSQFNLIYVPPKQSNCLVSSHSDGGMTRTDRINFQMAFKSFFVLIIVQILI